MEFNHSEEQILPDLTNILTIGGQALELPAGTSAQYPSGTAIGGVRFNTTKDELEVFNSKGWLPLSAAGQTVVTTSLNLNDVGTTQASTVTMPNTSTNQVVQSVSIAEYRSAFYRIQIASGSSYQTTTVTLIHDNTNVYISEINSIATNGTLATFTADINNGFMRLLVSPAVAGITIKSVVTLITA